MEVDRVDDPVEVPIDVMAYYDAGFARGATPQNPYPIALIVPGLLCLVGIAHRLFSRSTTNRVSRGTPGAPLAGKTPGLAV